MATKFLEHYIYIARAFGEMGDQGLSLWDEADGFFYDVLHTPDERFIPLKVRSFVGLIPLLAVDALEPELLEELPRFKRRMEWFLRYRPHLTQNIASLTEMGAHGHFQFAILGRRGWRGSSAMCLIQTNSCQNTACVRFPKSMPSILTSSGSEAKLIRCAMSPAESSSGLFGGNSNWRGPIWFPVNYLVIQALRRYHHHYGDTFQVEVPLGSGRLMTLDQAADELVSPAWCVIFQRGMAQGGRRPVFGREASFQTDPHWRDHIPFYEYFDGNTGAGVGASHQTGWTALVANLIADLNRENHDAEI